MAAVANYNLQLDVDCDFSQTLTWIAGGQPAGVVSGTLAIVWTHGVNNMAVNF